VALISFAADALVRDFMNLPTASRFLVEPAIAAVKEIRQRAGKLHSRSRHYFTNQPESDFHLPIGDAFHGLLRSWLKNCFALDLRADAQRIEHGDDGRRGCAHWNIPD